MISVFSIVFTRSMIHKLCYLFKSQTIKIARYYQLINQFNILNYLNKNIGKSMPILVLHDLCFPIFIVAGCSE